MSQSPEIIVTSFTSWSSLLEQLKNDMASGAWGKIQSYSLTTSGSSRTIAYRSFDDFLKIFKFVQDQAAIETGVPAFHGRTVAGNGGRF